MKTDIQIAQEAKLLKISEIASRLNITEDYYDTYGKYKAKLNLSLLDELANKKMGN